MPHRLAVAVLAAGALVVAFGALLPRFVHVRERGELTLQREPASATPEAVPSTDLRGFVRRLDGNPVAGAKVTLFSSTKAPSVVATDAAGAYRFRGLAIGGPYRVTVDYAGGVFEKIVLLPSSTVSITVAPTTTKPAAIRVRAASLAVVGDVRGVQALYAATIDNSDRDAYIGGVPLPVLPGAIAVDPQSGVDRSQLGIQNGTLFSSAPILPGATEVTFTYVAPIHADGLDATTPTTFPTKRFDLLVAGKLRTNVRGHANGSVRLGGRTYRRYTWRDLGMGDEAAARITPTSAAPLIRTIAIAAGGLVAVVIVIFPLVRRRRLAPARTAEPIVVKS
jgi:hypothetical protein